jgi:hypothetical protein
MRVLQHAEGLGAIMRTWDELVSDLEDLAYEMREKADAEPEPQPPDPQPPNGDVITVPAGGDLQAAINDAPDGAILELVGGAEYAGRFKIKKPVTIRTGGVVVDGRITPDAAPALALLPDGLQVMPRTCDVAIACVAIGGKNLNDIVMAGSADGTESDPQTTPEQQPDRVTFDQVIIRGHATDGAKRGIGANCKNLTIRRSYIGDIFRAGQDTQAICGWNGEGPFLIEDNTLEAAGENIMFGGSMPLIPGLIPADITIRGNTIRKPLEWKSKNYTVKNLIEFKVGKRIAITGNVLENSWAAGQMYALVITPVNDGPLPEATVSDYTFERNTVTGASCGFNILGFGQEGPTVASARITIVDNYFQISKRENGGQGWFMQIGKTPIDLHVEYNTIQMDGNQYIQGNAPAGVQGFRFVRNIVQNIGAYGTSLNWNGTDQKNGANWPDYFPGGAMSDNAFAGDNSTFKKNLPNNLHVATADAADLVVDGYGVGAFEGYGRRR